MTKDRNAKSEIGTPKALLIMGQNGKWYSYRSGDVLMENCVFYESSPDMIRAYLDGLWDGSDTRSDN